MRVICCVAAILTCCLVESTGRAQSFSPGNDPNGYFNALTARPEHFKSYALRSQAEIDRYSPRGGNEYVTYDPAMDAAKATIDAFARSYTLAASAPQDDDRLVLEGLNRSIFTRGRALKIGDEIVVVHQPGNSASRFPESNVVLVQRGQFGTRASHHGPGTRVQVSNNGLNKQVRVPIGTSDGHTYFFTWDVLYTDSYLKMSLDAHKAYQLADQQKSAIWLETRTRFNGQDALGSVPGFDRSKHVAAIDVRSYNTSLPKAPGSNVTDEEPLKPQVGRFVVWPNRWVRFFWYIDQRADDFDLATLWVADEVTDPVKIIDARTLTVRGNPPTIEEWYLELSASFANYRGKPDPLVSYARNVVVLQDVRNPTMFLQRPVGGRNRPDAPRNLRQVQ